MEVSMQDLRALLCPPLADDTELRIGMPVIIRTITHYYTGRVGAITKTEVLLDDSAWIPDTGRFSEALRTGKLNEVEPYPGRVAINRLSIVDWCGWPHALPRETK